YLYDPRLTFAENKRLAIEHYSLGEPLVPVVIGTPGHDEHTSHWLFVCGATLSNDTGSLPVYNYNPSAPVSERTHKECYVLLLQNIRRYWHLRLQSAEEEFKGLKHLATRHPSSASRDKLLSLTQEIRLYQDRPVRPESTKRQGRSPRWLLRGA